MTTAELTALLQFLSLTDTTALPRAVRVSPDAYALARAAHIRRWGDGNMDMFDESYATNPLSGNPEFEIP